MSDCISIYCKDCKKEFWIGQSSRSLPNNRRFYLYNTEKGEINALSVFIEIHLRHDIIIYNDASLTCEFENGYKEREVKELLNYKFDPLN